MGRWIDNLSKAEREELTDAGRMGSTRFMSDIPRIVPHPPHREGSRQHVVSYMGGYAPGTGEWRAWRVCSEPLCEINAERGRESNERE
jgi:hypothetical protein